VLFVTQDSCKPILGVAVDSQDEYLDHIEELTHKLCIAEKSIAVVKVCLCLFLAYSELILSHFVGSYVKYKNY